MTPLTLMWFRRDLRLHDNAAFYHALRRAQRENGRCIPFFCFDREILDRLEDRDDRRVKFIWQSVREMETVLEKLGSRLCVRHGRAGEVLPALIRELKSKGLNGVYANHDYEPGPLERDRRIAAVCAGLGVDFFTSKDHVVFEKEEVLTRAGTPQRVYTPYKKAWYEKLSGDPVFFLKAYPTLEKFADVLAPARRVPVSDPHATLGEIGFGDSDLRLEGGTDAARKMLGDFLGRIDAYGQMRNWPARKGVSYLSVHLRFGTLSIREIFRAALGCKTEGARKWADELVWREFYNAILHHHPQTVDRAFRPEFESVVWDDPDADAGVAARWEAWCAGKTGYPIVDAAMRQLNQTGYMHNRLRMIAASFLTKDLHIHWKRGERYFARKLLDYDLSQNVGGWQWSASTGADGQPYFRIFNPVSQAETWDPEG
ncbi:MAG: deoxyribodipyrimidine photo-lyase, partial [Verrucomicrobiae bacterium]|nr:deoxyribodipyrimidine photo-lyase [Verrucomicrobiae bacterium]